MRCRIAATFAGVLFAALPCLAQQPGNSQERKGFWIGFGAGYGSAMASASCEGCSGGGRDKGLTGFLKLGGTVNPRVLLGVESNAWTKSVDTLG